MTARLLARLRCWLGDHPKPLHAVAHPRLPLTLYGCRRCHQVVDFYDRELGTWYTSPRQWLSDRGYEA